MHNIPEQQVSVSLRIKLSEFIGTSYEESIMNKISELRVTSPFKLYLWYNSDSDIKHTDLKRFMMKWESQLSYKTVVRPTAKHPINEYVFFNILNENDSELGDLGYGDVPGRFKYIYKNDYKIVGIMSGLDSFEFVTNFCTKPKPPKQMIRQQKRNDGE